MPDETEILFTATTPLGFTVHVTKAYWDIIVTIKHPIMLGREEDVKKALEQPDEIRQSKSDEMASCSTKRSARNAGFAPFPSGQDRKVS